MRTATIFLPLSLALTSTALDISLGPDTVCGSNSLDCGNGFCCPSGSKCDTSGTITKCGDDPARPFNLGNIASAVQSKVASAVDNIPSSIAGQVQSIANNVPSSVAAKLSSAFDGTVPTGTALESLLDSVPTGVRGQLSSLANALPTELGLGSAASSGSGSGAPQNTAAGEGAGNALGVRTFGNTAVLVAGLWGVAALGGAGFLLL